MCRSWVQGKGSGKCSLITCWSLAGMGRRSKQGRAMMKGKSYWWAWLPVVTAPNSKDPLSYL
jgi:hypothetical protein